MQRLTVRFAADRQASGPITHGQRNVLAWIGMQQRERSDLQSRFLDLPESTTLTDVVEALEALLRRHEALRTTYFACGDGELRQRVTDHGELVIEVHEEDSAGSELLLRLDTRLRTDRFDHTVEFPLRLGVITRDGRPTRAVLVLSHVAVDFAGMEIVARELTDLMVAPELRRASTRPHQPLDQAALESSVPARRRAESAVKYWGSTMRRVPQCMFSLPEHPDGVPGTRQATLRSRAAALALPAIVARTGVSHSTVVLAAVGTLLAFRTGNRSCVLAAICGNRFQPQTRNYVGTIAQDALVAFDVDAPTFDDTVRATQRATLNAYRYSQFDVNRLYPTMDEVAHQRGTRFHRDCTFNDLGAHHDARSLAAEPVGPDELAAALTETEFRFVHDWCFPNLFYFTILELTDRLTLALYADTRYLPEPEIEAFLRGVERLLVAAAGREVPWEDIGAVSGVTPPRRGPAWVNVDNCWIDPHAVRELLADLPGIRCGQSFVQQVNGSGNSLVAYLVPDDPTRTPESVHAECVARLHGRFTAMAPHRYVLCADAPEDHSDLAAWRRQPILSHGSGRRPAG